MTNELVKQVYREYNILNDTKKNEWFLEIGSHTVKNYVEVANEIQKLERKNPEGCFSFVRKKDKKILQIVQTRTIREY